MGFFYKFKYFLTDDILGVKKNLSVIVEPFKVEILDSYVSPVVRYLEASCVDDVSHLIRGDELIILQKLEFALSLT